MIRLEGVTKVYSHGLTKVPALRGVSLSVDPGEFVAVMGPSGSGKSTLLQIMGALDTPTGGTVIINGHSIGELSDRDLTRLRRKDIGFIFQTFNLVAVLTARQNIALPCVFAREKPETYEHRVDELLRRVGLEERADAKPSQLSGGEQQRVAVARALVNQPKVVLADEPTGNLDHQTGRQILALLRDLNESGQTLVLVTHDATAAAFAERVISLRDGEVVKDTTLRDSRGALVQFHLD